jgi:hypothetical protein
MNWYYLPTSYVLARQPRHGRVQAPVARHYLPALEVKLASPVIRGFAARFLQYQTPGRYVPRPDAALVVTVQPPQGYIRDFRRAEAAVAFPNYELPLTQGNELGSHLVRAPKSTYESDE